MDGKWKGCNDPKDVEANLDITVEIVTGDVVDVIYQIKPLEHFGDHYWIKNYRQDTDTKAKIIIDTIIWNSKIGDKLIEHYKKSQKLSSEDAIIKLDEMTPLKRSQYRGMLRPLNKLWPQRRVLLNLRFRAALLL